MISCDFGALALLCGDFSCSEGVFRSTELVARQFVPDFRLAHLVQCFDAYVLVLGPESSPAYVSALSFEPAPVLMPAPAF